MNEVFDQTELMQQIDHDLGFLSEAVEMLREDCPQLIARVRAALRADDRAELKEAAHTLKGMLGNFCARPAVDAASRLEAMADGPDLSEGDDACRTVEDESHRLACALDSLLQTS